jgi:hypothetical protein
VVRRSTGTFRLHAIEAEIPCEMGLQSHAADLRPEVLLSQQPHEGSCVPSIGDPPRHMSNYAWVCFGCRKAVRRHGGSSDVRCPNCSQPCECLGYKVPIPPQSKAKAWEQLCVQFYRFRRESLLRAHKNRVRLTHEFEREIARLEAMEENRGRSETISYLKKRLEAVRR